MYFSLRILAKKKIQVNCPNGRTRVEWEEYVEGLTRKRGINLAEVRRFAQDRDEYTRWFKYDRDKL
jgi:hypothetical protein